MDSTAARSWLRNATLILFGLALGLCVLETGLQVAALLLRAVDGEPPAAWLGVGRRVLCLGDSNTYGVYLRDRQQAYPPQLERLWNSAHQLPPIEVLNLGYPGTNSSKLRHNLPEMLDTFRPDIVIVMVGANDCWTAPVPVGETARWDGFVQALKRHCRVYQLAYMLGRAFDQRRVEVERDVKKDGGRSGQLRYGDTEFAMGFTAAPRRHDHNLQLVKNLRAIAATIRSRGAEPVFMTYPSREENYGEAGTLIQATATQTGTRLIRLSESFSPVCPKEPCPEWLFADHHPTARGYQRIAETLLENLRDTL